MDCYSTAYVDDYRGCRWIMIVCIDYVLVAFGGIGGLISFVYVWRLQADLGGSMTSGGTGGLLLCFLCKDDYWGTWWIVCIPFMHDEYELDSEERRL